MVIDERKNRKQQILAMAGQIMSAGRTAPKGKGVDLIEIITIAGETKDKLTKAMLEVSDDTGMKFFIRDSGNIEVADAVILVGTRSQVMNLNCAYCGYAACAEKLEHPDVPCAINDVDVGIAIGSMCSVAADLRVDSRVMFSAGFAALRIGLMEGCRNIFAIPLSVSSKSPFFDRQSTK